MKRSRKELAKACVESLIDCWMLTYSSSPRRIIWQEPDMVLYCMGGKSAFENGILKARFTSKNMAARTEQAIDYFKRRRLPMYWWVDPWSTPIGLGDFLQKQGLTLEWEVPCMAIDLTVVRRKPLPAGLIIRPVKDVESLKTCVATAIKGFSGGGRTADDGWREAFMGLGLGPSKQWFTGFLDGKPVASSLLLLQGGLATIWTVATLKRARGRGIGSALTREPLLLAKDLGYDLVTIQASKMGLPVYEKIGFVEYSKIGKYLWTPK